jgi:hypothetical protein
LTSPALEIVIPTEAEEPAVPHRQARKRVPQPFAQFAKGWEGNTPAPRTVVILSEA